MKDELALHTPHGPHVVSHTVGIAGSVFTCYHRLEQKIWLAAKAHWAAARHEEPLGKMKGLEKKEKEKEKRGEK
jgi:hypothetical protein